MVARRGKKRALLAVGHKILCASYHILKNKEAFKELGADFLEERRKKNRLIYLKKELDQLGYQVEKVKEPVKNKDVKPTKKKVA